MIKELKLGLNDQAPVSVYGDLTKVYKTGAVAQKTIEGALVLGPPVSTFIDIQTDSLLQPIGAFDLTSNGRIFSVTAEAGGIVSLMLYNFNFSTGAKTYVGRVQFLLPDNPAQTISFKDVQAIDNGTTGWQVFIAVTTTTAQFNGVYVVNNLALTDFVPVGPATIPFATGNNQKAVYHAQTALPGVLNDLTGPNGMIFEPTSNKLYVHNGVAATHQYFVFDLNAAPGYSTSAISIDSATDVVSHAGHSFVAGDPVVFSGMTGGAPLVAGTTYFVINPVAGTSYQVSATVGGAAVNVTTNATGNVGRAHGGTSNLYFHKTGNLPALTGTLLTAVSEKLAIPGHTTNAGFACAFFSTSSNFYLGKLSELTSGATSWPSLITVNALGTPNQITVPTVTFATYSNVLDEIIYVTNASKFVFKSFVNNVINSITGELNNAFYETFYPATVNLGLVSVVGLDTDSGWLMVMGGTAGQRGIIAVRVVSDVAYDESYMITPVYDIEKAGLIGFRTIEKLFDSTGNLCIEYRTSGFGSASGGWVELPNGQDLSSFASADQVQFKIRFRVQSEGSSSPAQLQDVYFALSPVNAISDNWEYSRDDSSSGSPTRSTFRLKKVYSASVPNLRFKAADLSNSGIVDHTTAANGALFEYSTNEGATWSALGTIPNTVGTLLRYTFAVSPGVSFRPSLSEV